MASGATPADNGQILPLLAQAETILRATRGDVPEGFASGLFARSAAEDLQGFEPREIARLTVEAFDFLAVRPSGISKIRITPQDQQGENGGRRLTSVIEILNDNMPFLVDSVMSDLGEHDCEPLLVAHPVLGVERDGAGKLLGLRAETADVARESYIHIHVDRLSESAAAALTDTIEHTLAEVRVCVSDWRPMLAKVKETIAEFKANPPALPVEEIAEAIQFLEFLAGDNFTFLGIRDYRIIDASGELEPDFDTGLGILRDKDVRILRRGGELVSMTPEIRDFLREPVALIITKANLTARVHRRVHMDYIGLKRFDTNGMMCGEMRIVGLFTSTAYTRSARNMPYLRRKLDNVLRRAGFDPAGHSGKALVNVLESFPRDELFQIDEDQLYRFSLSILQLEERPRVRVLARRDRFDRFVSVLVYVPRERYDTTARIAIGKLLADIYRGRVVTFRPTFLEGHLTRVHFVIGRYEGATPEPDIASLERSIAGLIRTWSDGLREAVDLAHEPGQSAVLMQRYGTAFSASYRDTFTPEQAIGDIRELEALSETHPLGIDFYRPAGKADGQAGLKVWSRGRALPLSERVPMLESMGFTVLDERTYEIRPAEGAPVWLHDMALQPRLPGSFDMGALGPRLEAALTMVLSDRAESDGFGALVLAAGLNWRDVALMRTLARFLRQIRVPFSQDYLWACAVKHAQISARIIELFHARFDPRLPLDMAARKARQDEILAGIETMLEAVSSLDEDRMLRFFVNVVQAAVRTNFYQHAPDGGHKPTISIKFESRRIDSLPLPRPLYEIFVHSPRVEGVHLRFGKVARGGLRWSDRPQDFRTEVLGLVKAQQVKNAVIVPVGAKGGFVPMRLPPASDRAAWLAEGTEAYKIFVRSLLELTDNLDGETVVPPVDVVRHDGDDPYLVVAADKGTATFSDIANGLSADKGHWLGDAFASGGSVGYDHKKMGITARGAWEAVRRHFREMDVDIRVTPFTVAGVGDMSGDVFGNGMLLERTIKLVAAFDHRDIFLDPDPDPETSFAERQRMFALPRSSWADYDKSLISAGGGVFSRALKAIPLSPALRSLLAIDAAEATPQQVMNAILRAPVDLLWFGGIGTYVRASSETDDQAGDRANDPIRITGRQVRARVVGEGANLGMTQRGRIEAAEAGARLNTDAIDNSAGVNSSDVEVNIKIALAIPVRDGRLDQPGRNALLAEMTPDVASLVLRNNYQQTLALSLAERRGIADLGFQQRLMQTLEGRGLLDRSVEFLPDDMTIAKRAETSLGLTRPELSVLLAYAKLTLFDELVASDVPDDPYLAREAMRYFPSPIQQLFPDAVEAHRLRREIISTQLANSIINRGGPSFIARITDQTGAEASAIARAFAVVRDAFGMTALNGRIDELDARIPGALQLQLYAAVQEMLESRVVWVLRNTEPHAALEGQVSRFAAGIAALRAGLAAADDAKARTARIAALVAKGVPEELAGELTDLPMLETAFDAVLVAEKNGASVAEAGTTLLALAQLFDAGRLKAAADQVTANGRFERLALDRVVDGLDLVLRQIAGEVLAGHGAGDAGLAGWQSARGAEIERVRRFLADIGSGSPSLPRLSVAVSLIGDLVRG